MDTALWKFLAFYNSICWQNKTGLDKKLALQIYISTQTSFLSSSILWIRILLYNNAMCFEYFKQTARLKQMVKLTQFVFSCCCCFCVCFFSSSICKFKAQLSIQLLTSFQYRQIKQKYVLFPKKNLSTHMFLPCNWLQLLRTTHTLYKENIASTRKKWRKKNTHEHLCYLLYRTLYSTLIRLN